MEFKYRAIDKRPPIHSSSTPNNAVLHNHDFSFGRNVGVSVGSVNGDSVSQIPPMEAERLREQFILEEIRRHELKAEIMREFMFERQMSFLSNAAGERGGGFFSPSVSNDGLFPPYLNFGRPDGIWASERFPGLFSNFPFDPSMKLSSMEAGVANYGDSDRRRMALIGGTENGKTSLGFGPHLEETALPKPKEALSEEKITLSRNCKRGLMIQQLSDEIPKPQTKKHKSQGPIPLWGNMKKESLMINQNDEIQSSTRTKTPKRQTSCVICEAILTSEKMLEEHLKGKKKHKAKEARLKSRKVKLVAKEKCGPTPLNESLSVKQATTKLSITKSNEEKRNDDSTTKDMSEKSRHKFWCKLCKVGTTSEVSMNVHQNGSKHMNLLHKNGGGLIIVSTLPDTIEEDKTIELLEEYEDGEIKVEEKN